MSQRNALARNNLVRSTVFRSLHDLGLAAWFGGTLAGVIGIDRAAAAVPDKRERLRVASEGWGRWSRMYPVAVGVHLVGGTGVLLENKGRVVAQRGVGASTIAKAAVTAAAIGATAWSGVLGRRLGAASEVPVEGSTEPAPTTPPDVERTQRQMAVLEWAVPVLTGALIVLNAVHGEQQRPSQVLPGLLQRPARLLGVAA
jgi:putative copper export protein